MPDFTDRQTFKNGDMTEREAVNEIFVVVVVIENLRFVVVIDY